jgi:hypothetical protein
MEKIGFSSLAVTKHCSTWCICAGDFIVLPEEANAEDLGLVS